MGVRINEIKVWTYQIWGKAYVKHDGDTPGAQFGHEAAEDEINKNYNEESEDTHHHHIYRDQDKYKNAPKRPQNAPPEG